MSCSLRFLVSTTVVLALGCGSVAPPRECAAGATDCENPPNENGGTGGIAEGGAPGSESGGAGGERPLTGGTSAGGTSAGGTSAGGAHSGGSGGTSAECVPDERQCENGVPRTCDVSGHWANEAPCVDSTCVDGQCIGSCASGQVSCSSNTPQTCSDQGAWVPGDACQNQTCVDGSCVGECAPGQTSCDGNTPQTCSATGTFEGTTECVDQTCIDGVCSGECQLGGPKRCHENHVLVCGEPAHWHVTTDCTDADRTCVDGSCQGVCAPGQRRCSNNGVQTCTTSGTWGIESSCSPHGTCRDYPSYRTAVCEGDCGPGEKTCDGNYLLSCQNTGAWSRGSCNNNDTCVASTDSSGRRAAECTCGWLDSGQRLTGWLWSCDGRFRLSIGGGRAAVTIFDTVTVTFWEVGQAPTGSAFAVMQEDGNFVVYGQGCTGPNGSCWNTGTGGHWGASIVLQEDGNFVIYGPTCPGPYGACWSRYG